MFGYVAVDPAQLSAAARSRYREIYCGLCRTLRTRHGQLSGVTLSYDMAFLILLLSSMYEPEETVGSGRCLLHPIRSRSWSGNRFTDYAADMTVALAYHNFLDDWTDDRSPVGFAGARLLRDRYAAVAAQWPAQCAAMERCLGELHGLEVENAPAPDGAADCFGRLMGSLFAVEQDSVWNARLRSFGEKLGRFVYLMDACMDLERDKRRGGYNPLLRLHPEGMTEQEQDTILKITAGECAAAFEQLPLVQDTEILRCVLYSGVWARFTQKKQKRKGGAGRGAGSV